MTMSSHDWDERYADTDLVWSAGPNVWVEQFASTLSPGTVLDLAGGEGRNSIWLAEQGWTAVCVDFSTVALDRALKIAAARLGDRSDHFMVRRADLLSFDCEIRHYNLVLLSYFHAPEADRDTVLRCAAETVAPGGHLLVVAHHSDNLTLGVGGPQNPDVLYTEFDVADVVEAAGLQTVRADRVLRPVTTQTDTGPETRNAVDVVYVGRRAE